MTWKKTSCCLCFTNCGLEVLVENNLIIKVRPDKDNPRSRGYCCRKGLNIAHHQHHADRLMFPLKKVGDHFESVSWDQAISEIADRLRKIVDQYGPRSFAYMGGGGQGCQLEGMLGVPFMRALGSRNHYTAAAQEWSGEFWVNGRCLGRQNFKLLPDHHASDMLLAVGWNGMVSHSTPRTPVDLKAFSDDPSKLLVVIDPRKSETAELADVHLALRPGTDALLTRAMIAIIIQEGWQNQNFINDHTNGLAHILPWFTEFDAEAAVDVCELDYEQVRYVSHQFATRRSCMHSDLGILMNRHSTVTSYLHLILLAVCGRIGAPGGNVLPGCVAPLGGHTDDRDPLTWRTVSTNIPTVCGYFPPNVMPEEILNEHAERIRAVIVSASNPLRSYADTRAYEEAFKRLDLLVCVELAMTETAVLADYILPARSAYESFDTSFFAWTYPDVFFQLRRPVVEPEGEQVEAGEVFLKLAKAMGMIPELPKTLYESAEHGCSSEYFRALANFLKAQPKAKAALPFIIATTLGQSLGSVNLASLCGMLQSMPGPFRENAARMGFTTGSELGVELFEEIINHHEGLWVGKCDSDNNLKYLATEDHRIHLYIPELQDWVKSINPVQERDALRPDSRFPLVLVAGRHCGNNANTLMRNPAWLKDRRGCTLLMHPDDAKGKGVSDGQRVRVITEAGEGLVELEISDNARPGQVVLPHGFGLTYQGETFGLNVNQLTISKHRDKMLGTPLHRYVPCRVEAE